MEDIITVSRCSNDFRYLVLSNPDILKQADVSIEDVCHINYKTKLFHQSFCRRYEYAYAMSMYREDRDFKAEPSLICSPVEKSVVGYLQYDIIFNSFIDLFLRGTVYKEDTLFLPNIIAWIS